MEQPLRLRPGQRQLTPEQRVEASRLAAEYLQTQLSTRPVDEAVAVALLKQAYTAARLAAPCHICWVDGPMQLVAFWFPEGFWDGVHEEPVKRDNFWDTITASASESVWDRAFRDVMKRVDARIGIHRSSSWDSSEYRAWDNIVDNLWRFIWRDVDDRVLMHTWNIWKDRDDAWKSNVQDSRQASVMAYRYAPDLACYSFLDTDLAPNDLHALAQFNALVSGYWLGKEIAILVRRPTILSWDDNGRPHSATGRCIEYHDGWGMYAWHGVETPEKVILTPDTLTRDDFLGERNLEVRRIIQERMGQRFVWELEGKFIDGGSHGILYEVELPDDPERVARYVQVQDASTPHQYFLRVPPTIQTAAEAVAWTFGATVEEYHPVQET
jgi:hypothetical protein